MDNEKYILTIANNDFKFLEELELDGYLYSLEKLSYDKGIYRPAEITATMNVAGEGVKYGTLVDSFYMKDVKLTINDNPVAENYFVFKVKPSFRTVSNASSVKLELTIYSQDKLMTLDKYSKAWTGKKLGEDIFKKEVESFTFNGDPIDTSYDLQVVNYSSGEFIQPYLVQYNESFYDFLKRTANRCGEFLYHENGQLHLGMEVNDVATDDDPDYAEIAVGRYYEDILREGTETSDYAYNYLKDKPEPDKKPYSNPLASDEYLSSVKPEFTDWDEQKDYISKNVLGSICMALGAPTLSKILSNVSTDMAFKMTKAIVVAKNLNDKYAEVNISPWNGKNEQKGIDLSVSQFSTMSNQTPKSGFGNKNVNLNAEFYALVREAEKKVSENAVYLDFGESTQNLSIGDKIKVDGVNYIVIGVNGGCELSYSDDPTKKSTPRYEERQQVTGVMLYGDVAIPPAQTDIVIRESQPQLAFVTANFDPEKIGRVRVRFAWQPKSNDGSDASPWIRVSLPFATNGGGVRFKPEVGDEVMVSFEEGNMERPYVSGFLLSSHSKDSWGYLPDRGITSKNGHGITFNDNLDGGTFFYGLFPFLQTLRAYVPTVDWPKILENNEICTDLAGGMTISDRFGLYKIDLSSTSRSVTIQSGMGNVTLNALTGINISAPNGDIKIHGKNVSIEASDTVSIESGQAVKERFLAEDDCYSEDGLGVFTRIGRTFWDAGKGFVNGVANRTVDNVIDTQLLRAVSDIVLRPIDGTTRIKSPTFVQIEAGKGSAEYPRSARKESNAELAAYDLLPSIDLVASTMGARVKSVEKAYNTMCVAIANFNEISGEGAVNPDGAVISFDDIVDDSYQKTADKLTFQWDQVNLDDIKSVDELKTNRDNKLNDLENNKPKADDENYKNDEAAYEKAMKSWKETREKIIGGYQDALKDRKKKIKEVKNQIESKAQNLSSAINQFYRATNVYFCSDTVSIDSIFKDDIKKVLADMTFADMEITNDLTAKDQGYWDKQKKHYMRLAVYNLLSNASVASKANCEAMSFGSSSKSLEALDNDNNWAKVVNDIVGKGKTRNWFARKYFDPAKDAIVNRKRWKVGMEGKILLSDNSEKTITFNKNGEIKATDNVIYTDKSSDEMISKLAAIGN